MNKRVYWLKKFDKSWQKRSLIWLSGVRRIGKTTLTKMLPRHSYLNCDLPSVARKLSDPEFFYQSMPKNSLIVFDEIHRLSDPSLVLKIATDEFPTLKLLATGSSTLEATSKFKDSLTGRKKSLYLPPVLWTECLREFDIHDIDHRLLHGGFPETLLASKLGGCLFVKTIGATYGNI